MVDIKFFQVEKDYKNKRNKLTKNSESFFDCYN